MRALVVGFHGQEGGHLVGFDVHRRELEQSLGLEIVRVDADSLPAVENAIDRNPSEVVFVSLDWRWEGFAQDAHVDLFRRLAARQSRPKLVFLDCVDQTSSPFFGVLPYVDAFGKAKLLRNVEAYRQEYRGGFIFADWFSARYGFDLDWWHFGTEMPPGHEWKLVPIWSFGILSRYRRRLFWSRVLSKRWQRRSLDLNIRFAPEASDYWQWYHEHRKIAEESAKPLVSKMRLSGHTRIPRRRYLRELKRSKMVLSPFGWGEICYRDYEAIISGALLVKPSVAHLRTEPDLFIDRETYVPIEWDFSDLEEKCDYYLEHADEAETIVRTAQERLMRYYRENRFVRIVRNLLDVAFAGESAVEESMGQKGSEPVRVDRTRS